MISSASSLSWCASAGLEVVTSKTPERSSTSSHNPAGSEPITVRNAEATWRPLAASDAPADRARDEIRRERADIDRRDHDLPAVPDLAEQRPAALQVQLGQHVVEQEHGPLAVSPGHQVGLRQLQAHHGGALLALGGIAASLLAVEQQAQVVAVRTHTGRASAQVVRERVMHSRREVFRRTQIADLEPFSTRDLVVAAAAFGCELAHGRRPRVDDLGSDSHELRVPHLEDTWRILAGGDPLQHAVALLQDPAEPRAGARLSWLDLNQELIQKTAALFRPGLD